MLSCIPGCSFTADSEEELSIHMREEAQAHVEILRDSLDSQRESNTRLQHALTRSQARCCKLEATIVGLQEPQTKHSDSQVEETQMELARVRSILDVCLTEMGSGPGAAEESLLDSVRLQIRTRVALEQRVSRLEHELQRHRRAGCVFLDFEGDVGEEQPLRQRADSMGEEVAVPGGEEEAEQDNEEVIIRRPGALPFVPGRLPLLNSVSWMNAPAHVLAASGLESNLTVPIVKNDEYYLRLTEAFARVATAGLSVKADYTSRFPIHAHTHADSVDHADDDQAFPAPVFLSDALTEERHQREQELVSQPLQPAVPLAPSSPSSKSDSLRPDSVQKLQRIHDESFVKGHRGAGFCPKSYLSWVPFLNKPATSLSSESVDPFPDLKRVQVANSSVNEPAQRLGSHREA